MLKKILFLLILFLSFLSCKTTSPTLIVKDADLKNKTGIDKPERRTYTYDKDLSEKDQEYFASKLNVGKTEIQNKKLYIFIKSWEEVTYLWGGEDKNGIDCSALMQELYKFVYNITLPRTSFEMGFNTSDKLKFFTAITDLKEGNLVFFRMKEEKAISHVGVYLKNNKFFAANTAGGCQIVSLKDPYWGKKFIGGARLRK